MKPSNYNWNFNQLESNQNKEYSEPSKVLVSRQPCPNCRNQGKDRKGNNLALYADGHKYCYSCSFLEFSSDNNQVNNRSNIPVSNTEDPIAQENNNKAKDINTILQDYNPKEVQSARGITAQTYSKYGVQVTPEKHKYPYYDNENNLIGLKTRIVANKTFPIVGDVSKQATLFGSNLFPKGSSKNIVITEGEEDAMAAFQLLGDRVPCVYINIGSSHAQKCVQNNYEYLDSFEEIYLCFDNDEPGREAREKVAKLFTPGKIKIMEFPLGSKDANDVLLKGGVQDFNKMYKGAKTWAPDGLVYGDSL